MHPATPEEQALIARVGDHSTINKAHVIQAAETMLVEPRRLVEGEYSMLAIGYLFIDCADRTLQVRQVQFRAQRNEELHQYG